ncbi:Phytanoyl-CoA dioxygenase family protein [Aspergillus sp. HF37]|nr:Phytanoyl-CoA dioxygenase family protein [Aspergillus sp. HF37]
MPPVPNRLFTLDSPNIEDFKQLCSQTTDKSTYPLSAAIDHNVPVYNASHFTPHDSAAAAALQNEWHHILHSGPGIFVLKDMYAPSQYASVLDSANASFQRIIAHEASSSSQPKKGDHFSATGRNDRIWNSFSKHGLDCPPSFLEYYSNPWLALVAESWLGPIYRVTAQVNVVKPGGAAQDPHRDYHLGFQSADAAAAFPATMHRASQFLTLQGAVAHSHMPPRSGPTRFLPFSQLYPPGYLAYRRLEFREFFAEKYVAVPLALGDGVFFNPAVVHAAGANELSTTAGSTKLGEGEGQEFHRKANLLQISSGFGKAMESVDSVPLVDAVWNILVDKYTLSGRRLTPELTCFVRAVADGYPFPTNLDKRPPAPSGMAPESEQEIVFRGLAEGWDRERVVRELVGMRRESGA